MPLTEASLLNSAGSSSATDVCCTSVWIPVVQVDVCCRHAQAGNHDSIEDSRAALALYRKYEQVSPE